MIVLNIWLSLIFLPLPSNIRLNSVSLGMSSISFSQMNCTFFVRFNLVCCLRIIFDFEPFRLELMLLLDSYGFRAGVVWSYEVGEWTSQSAFSLAEVPLEADLEVCEAFSLLLGMLSSLLSWSESPILIDLTEIVRRFVELYIFDILWFKPIEIDLRGVSLALSTDLSVSLSMPLT